MTPEQKQAEALKLREAIIASAIYTAMKNADTSEILTDVGKSQLGPLVKFKKVHQMPPAGYTGPQFASPDDALEVSQMAVDSLRDYLTNDMGWRI